MILSEGLFWIGLQRSCLKFLRDYSEVTWKKIVFTEQENDWSAEGGRLFLSLFSSFFGPSLGEAVSLSFCQSNQGEAVVVNQIHKEFNEDNPNIWEADPMESFWLGFPKMAPPDLVKFSGMDLKCK